MKLSFVRIISIIILGFVFKGSVVLADQPKNPSLDRAFERFVGQNSLQFGQASLTVVDGTSGDRIYDHLADLGMATASTLKNITAITAMHVLGADFRFETTLGYMGTIDQQGTLHGHLIIRGTGDPTLGSDRYDGTNEEVILAKWLKSVQNAGIKRIQGGVVADDLLYDGYQSPGGWPWRDMGNYYGAGVSSVNWRENSFGVVFQPASTIGDPTKIRSTTADMSYLQIVNEVTTARNGSGDNVYGYSAPYSNQIFLRGTHGADLKKTIRLSVPDPAKDLAFQFTTTLEQSGVSVANAPYALYNEYMKSAIEPLNGLFSVLDVHQSPPLPEIVYWFNQVSINLYGESLLKTIALKLDKPTETASAAAAVRQFWQEKLDIPSGAFKMVDGSGLSPDNRITTAAMVQILQSSISEPWFDLFYESIPTNNGMKIKSGTIGGVLGYAGYHTAANGRKYTFALLVSNYQGSAQAMRREMFKLLDELK